MPIKAENPAPQDSNPSFLQAVIPEDGRWRGLVEPISAYFSEFATARNRVLVEVEWLKTLSKVGAVRVDGQPRVFQNDEISFLDKIVTNFSLDDARQIWDIDENETNHDTRAAEVFLGRKFTGTPLEDATNYLHFGLTSTDTDNLALMLSLRDFVQEAFFPTTNQLLQELGGLASRYKDTPMMARTHGVPAMPTTVGKEMATFAEWTIEELEAMQKLPFQAKIGGAVGNLNELYVAFPDIDWKEVTAGFIRQFGFEPQDFTTQSEYHGNEIAWFDKIIQVARIGKKLAQDLWLYNMLGFTRLGVDARHTGSSVMAHKANPIGTERAERYFGKVIAGLQHLSNEIMDNRLQRDLTDKYALRDVGEYLADLYIATISVTDVIANLGFHEKKLHQELDEHWEILSAPLQTILRTVGFPNPFDTIRALAREQVWNEEDYHKIVEGLNVASEVKERLLALTPWSYLGNAVALTEKALADIQAFSDSMSSSTSE